MIMILQKSYSYANTEHSAVIFGQGISPSSCNRSNNFADGST